VRDNIIAFNGGTGVQVATGSDNAIVANSIYANADMQINLGWDGVNKNDAADVDSGANGLQNTPVLSSATRSATATTIAGTITSRAKTAYYIELFAGSGKTFIRRSVLDDQCVGRGELHAGERVVAGGDKHRCHGDVADGIDERVFARADRQVSTVEKGR
jgi:hypothetical protein